MALIELLVGIALGLLVIGAAIGTLVISRQTSGTVSEVSQLQQQASYAMRTFGLQLRSAGALELVQMPMGGPFTFNDLAGAAISGVDGASGAADALTVSNQPSVLPTLQRDCTYGVVTGLPANPSVFSVNGTSQLTCLGTNPVAIAQPVVDNVADFQVSYRVNVGSTTAPSFQILPASTLTATQWTRVSAIETCLDLRGTEPMPDMGTTYVNCQGVSVPRGGRNHFVSRNVFFVRRQSVF